ncbi:sodium/calcium exchanger 2 isoform X1 [Pogonomyrmex barbatus]|uniref:Sodium/calcium exchanger 2 isoform X1 n=2 Tax=Pogonomyrmex barbatus TaxID=144034 RepID=A0A6I9W750_9HYME|nr:sodium/calcium exchanger 2 isoform X1 [Pogonomyrmex barbatus]XP_011634464.1 sodium/calcium exchanger 2 isoform X1 [Pogonomyrmex barbatus]XP_011634465.1 sodium/calcium exchanger 2 isoform X1 [Pogonomyrmex barbatus]XP_025073639.1 sodium/calcium exchanger 2 isoform X1 [Pogonomyrmex barbatus]XP_025073640.1 sodium/calcium exchanger 2 isoform X1 [Pogonomyrmex barbatus]
MSGNYSVHCEPGLVVPLWHPEDNLHLLDIIFRGVVYFFALLYLFIGVSIISDRFMAAIEVITSKEKELVVRRQGREPQIVVVRVWNETVANLTLMALGSSAPEILLSIIEIWAKNFQAGELGPGTIVGSAAYNLFVIISLCVFVIPNGETRKIKHLRVFFVTATWSIFAYVWLYVILAVSSPGVLEIWEGILTFAFFPATVLTAYVADRRLLIYKYLHKGYRMNKRGVIVQAEAGDSEMGMELDIKPQQDGIHGIVDRLADGDSPEAREFEQTRRDYINTLKELRKKYPILPLEQLEVMAHEEVLGKGPKSRAFYRVQATRKMVGAGNLSRKISERAQSDLSEVKAELQKAEADSIDIEHVNAMRVFFEPGHYTVMENVGTFEVGVSRAGGDLSRPCTVDYCTEDGSAEAGSDYVSAKGTLTFGPGETTKTIKLSVIDDELFEEDEHFYVRLSNVSQPAMLVSPSLATVMILDDDHSGIFGFPERDVELVESVGQHPLRVVRYSGARGRVIVPYRTVEGTAKPGKQYVHTEGSLTFEDNQTEKIINLEIIEEDSYEKDALFYVELDEPLLQGAEAGIAAAAEMKLPENRTEEEKMALLGRPRLGEVSRAQIRIKESKEFKNTVDKLVQRANASIILGTSSWKEQFTEALTVSGGDEDDSEGSNQPSSPSVMDYLMHSLTIFWKVLFAFVPPTDIAGGYLCFIVSILGIGVVTAIIGDIASYFGCTLGIKDSVTAIVFVALGTSIPDTFASKVAACQDKYADASVGNVTGSNAVNVFLGIGVAWSIAAIYHTCRSEQFVVKTGNLAFSVTLFCSEACFVILVLLVRRVKSIGGELGGPFIPKLITSVFLFSLWLLYLIMSTLEAYGVIQGF